MKQDSATFAEAMLDNEFLNCVLESSTECIKILDLDGRLQFMSAQGMVAMEVDDLAAIQGCRWLDFWSGEHAGAAQAAFAAARAGGTGRFQGFCPTLKGTPRWWDVVVTPIRRVGGPPERLLSISRDVTELKRSELARQESEERLRRALRAGNMGTWDWHIPTGEVAWSELHFTLLGYQVGEVTPSYEAWAARVHPEDLPGAEAEIRRTMAAGQPYAHNFRFLHPNGRVVWCEAEAHYDYARDGTPLRMVGMIRDITPRKLAELSLAQTEERYRLAARATNDAIWDWDLARDQVLWNEAVETLFGHRERATDAAWWENRLHPEDRDWVLASIRAALAGSGGQWCEEYRFKRADGAYASVLDRGFLIRDAAGRPLRMVGAMLDQTERKDREAALARSEAELRALVETVAAGVAQCDLRLGRFIRVNRRFCEIAGSTEAELLGGLSFQDLTHPEDRSEDERAFFAAMAAGREYEVEKRYLRPDGTTVWVRVNAAPAFFDEQGGVIGAVAVVQDITARRLTEAALARSERRLRLAQDSGGIATWEWDVTLDRSTWSDSLYRLIGLDPGSAPACLDTFMNRVVPEDRAGLEAQVAEALERGYLDAEFRVIHPDGVRWVAGRGEVVRDEAGRPLRMMGVNFDVTDRRRATEALERLNQELEGRVQERTEEVRREMAERQRAEGQLLQAQRLEALGRLTGGVAHDFNNKLQVITAHLESVAHRIENSQIRRGIVSALVAAESAAGLIEKLLTFARQQETRAETLDIAERLRSTADMLTRSMLGDGIDVVVDAPERLGAIQVDPSDFEAALLNLAVNARDAMPDGGVITVTARDASPDEVPPGESVAPGPLVRITVADTGAGIAADILPRVVEPFFTTKEFGKGTGLGLSQVWGFARQAGGCLTIDSAPGLGTQVSLFLPRAGAEKTSAAAAPFDGWQGLAGGPPRAEIMLVDDDPEVAAAMAALLEGLGYRARVAIGTQEAIAMLASSHPDLVMTDVAMPGALDGVGLAQEIRRRDPDLPVLLVTGNPRTLRGADDFPVLVKPVTAGAVEAALSRLLEQEIPEFPRWKVGE